MMASQIITYDKAKKKDPFKGPAQDAKSSSKIQPFSGTSSDPTLVKPICFATNPDATKTAMAFIP